MDMASPLCTVTVWSWKSSGLPMPYRQETDEMTMTSRRPDIRAEAALTRSSSILSLILRSFSI